MAPPDGFIPYGRTPTQADNTRDMGTATQRWRSLYLGTSLVLQGATYKHYTLVGATLARTAPSPSPMRRARWRCWAPRRASPRR